MLVLASIVDSLTDRVSGSPITYLITFIASGGDVLFPPIPSESIVITAGVVATRGDLAWYLLVLCAAAGSFVGDNTAYWLGRKVGEPVADRLFRGEEGQSRLHWAERAVRSHGILLVVVGRFIPGGRTAATFAAGLLEMPYRRFLLADLVAVSIWGTYAVMLGYLGGSTFQDSTWKPLAVALGIGTLVILAVELYRRWQKAHGKDILGDPLEPADT